MLSSEQKTPFGSETAANAMPRVSSYQYNQFSGALIEQTYPSGRVIKNTFDQDGDLAQVQSKKNANAGYWKYAGGFAHDTAGNVTKMQLGNGLWETASYNNRQQVTTIGLGVTDDVQGLLKLELGYGSSTQNNGAMREQKITVPTVGQTAGFTATQTYVYDNLNRLYSATETIPTTQTWKQTFTIDRYGNRSFDINNNNTTTLGSCTSMAVCNPIPNTSDNRLPQSSGYHYDANGNLTQNAAGERFVYDQENHQTKFFNAGNGGSTPNATYHYDGEGRRVRKISSTETTIFVYDGLGKLVAEYSTQLEIAAPLDDGNIPQVRYLTTDHLGSPRVITNKNGAVLSRKDFAAFGEESITAQRTPELGYEPSEIRHDYTGYEKDAETGLEYAQARYYNPTHGRFTSVDPLTASASTRNPQTFNRYSYVLNSPYKYTDPLGLLSQSTGADGGCNFQCRVNKGINGNGELSEEDKELAKFHIRNGTALGYAFLNASHAEIKRQNAQMSSSAVTSSSASGSAVLDNRITYIGDFIADGRIGPNSVLNKP